MLPRGGVTVHLAGLPLTPIFSTAQDQNLTSDLCCDDRQSRSTGLEPQFCWVLVSLPICWVAEVLRRLLTVVAVATIELDLLRRLATRAVKEYMRHPCVAGYCHLGLLLGEPIVVPKGHVYHKEDNLEVRVGTIVRG